MLSVILIDTRKLKFLLAGRKVTVEVTHGRYRKDHVYAVGVHHRKTVCHARVLLVSPQEGSWLLELTQSMDEAPRLLARNPAAQRTDYVANPAKAAWGEPEAIGVRDLARLGRMNRERFEQNRAAERAEQPLAERVAELEARAREGDAQAQRHLFVIEQRLEAAAKRRARLAA